MELSEMLRKAVREGNGDDAVVLTKQALSQGVSAREVLEDALIPAMDAVGEGWKRGEIFIPEVLEAASAMKAGLAVIRPLLTQGNGKLRGKVVLGTVEGDLHDIGKNIVGMMLEGNGFEVVDLGVDVPISKFVTSARELKADVVGLSTLMSTTLPTMQATVSALRQQLGDKLQIMVGGAPVNKPFGDKIGATGYAPDALKAVAMVKEIIMNV